MEFLKAIVSSERRTSGFCPPHNYMAIASSQLQESSHQRGIAIKENFMEVVINIQKPLQYNIKWKWRMKNFLYNTISRNMYFIYVHM